MAFLRRHGGLLALALVVMTVPAYLSDRYYLLILAQVAWRFIACIGLSLLVGQAGQISLGQAGFVGIGAYGAGILTTRLGLDPWLALLLAAGWGVGDSGAGGHTDAAAAGATTWPWRRWASTRSSWCCSTGSRA